MIEGADPARPLEGGEHRRLGRTTGTMKVGTVKLPAGDGRIVVRPGRPAPRGLLDLRTVSLVPPGETPKAEPESKN